MHLAPGLDQMLSLTGAASLDLSRQMREMRGRTGLKQSEVARRLGIDPSIPSLWESGKRLVPVNRVPGLAEAFETDVETFLSAGCPERAPVVRACRQCGASCEPRDDYCVACQLAGSTHYADAAHNSGNGHAARLVSLLAQIGNATPASTAPLLALVPRAMSEHPEPEPPPPPAPQITAFYPLYELAWCTSSHGARDADGNPPPTRLHHHGVKPVWGPIGSVKDL
jgi:DNA-binding XRE family transcriptional regulator